MILTNFLSFCRLASLLIEAGKQVGVFSSAEPAQVSRRRAPCRLCRNWEDSWQAHLHLTLTWPVIFGLNLIC